jgi:hypothetical protein
MSRSIGEYFTNTIFTIVMKYKITYPITNSSLSNIEMAASEDCIIERYKGNILLYLNLINWFNFSIYQLNTALYFEVCRIYYQTKHSLM